ncbi:MAG TPA: DNA polymerase III subunit alpha, partial [Candidatus Krumholzibacteriaceae bacterium]
MPYVPLHVHSTASGPEGIMGVRELVSRASFLGFDALALTDHRTTYGHFEFFEAARGAGIKPVLGAEIQHASLVSAGGVFHLTVLAENEEGYRNLCAVISRHSSREKEPHVSVEDLERHRAGLIVLTGCLRGEASQAILHGNLGRSRDVLARLAAIFGASNVFIEIMNHGKPEESLIADQLRELSTRVGIPSVITNNDRYMQREDAEYFRIARRIGRKKSEGEAEEPVQEYYLKRERELIPFFSDERDALDRSGEIAERCAVDLSRAGRISFSSAPNPHDALIDMCRRRFLLAFHAKRADERSHLKRALDRELALARDEELSGFLLFLRELFASAGERGIWLELMGRDLLESLIAYLLEISPLNPVEHDLVFQSFSPSGRGTIPAMELIISEQQKEQLAAVIAGLIPGYEPRFQIAQEEMSVVTIAKEAAEVFGAPPELRDEISRILTFERRHGGLSALVESSEAARRLYNAEPAAKSILHAAYALQGKLRHFTLDTSKLVILPRELDGLYSVVENAAGERFVQLSGAAIERLGGWLVGVQHSHFLSALEKTIESLEREDRSLAAPRLFKGSERKRWAPESLDDPRTFALISSGETIGVYLLESQGIRDHLVEIKPATFDELVNVISLYRPGPLEGRLWEKYIGNAEKKGKVLLPHPSLASILAGTRGVLLYREQVREVLEETAGLRGKDAIAVEGALWSRDSGELVSARLAFVRGAMDAGLNEEDGQRIFDFLLHNIAFTHSKSLSCAQASLSYRTAYLKTHCFEKYFTALLNSNLGVRERLGRYLEYLKEKGVPVLPFGINADGIAFSYEDGVIRGPLFAVISLEKGGWDTIVEERIYRGDFASFEEFLERMRDRISKEAAMELIERGVFDGSGLSRDRLGGMCESFYRGEGAAPPAASHPRHRAGAAKGRRSTNQTSLFGPERDDDPADPGRGRSRRKR